jgi:hypothetical protein
MAPLSSEFEQRRHNEHFTRVRPLAARADRSNIGFSSSRKAIDNFPGPALLLRPEKEVAQISIPPQRVPPEKVFDLTFAWDGRGSVRREAKKI